MYFLKSIKNVSNIIPRYFVRRVSNIKDEENINQLEKYS